ncbi:MAG: class II aldolase/adducin family protein [Christensenellales bacterium]|jgi:L-fuculose-phosphate aldolase
MEELRKHLCMIAKMLDHKGLVSGTDGNISLRIDENTMLITPSGVNKGMLAPDMLLIQDFDGTVKEGVLRSSREASLHAGVYRVRADVGAIVHTHPPFATAYAACGVPVEQDILIELPAVLGKTQVVPFAAPGSKKLAEFVSACAKDSPSNLFLLQNHGVIACGTDLTQAYNRMDALENAAKTIFIAKTAGEVKRIPQEELALLSYE